MHACIHHTMRCCPQPFVGVSGIGSSGLYLGSVHKGFGLYGHQPSLYSIPGMVWRCRRYCRNLGDCLIESHFFRQRSQHLVHLYNGQITTNTPSLPCSPSMHTDTYIVYCCVYMQLCTVSNQRPSLPPCCLVHNVVYTHPHSPSPPPLFYLSSTRLLHRG